MIKKVILLTFIALSYLLSTSMVMAVDIPPRSVCDIARIQAGTDRCRDDCSSVSGTTVCIPHSCQLNRITGIYRCEPDVFGQVQTPEAIKNLGFGSEGISKFLNNLIVLIYMLASVVFVFMILWGAFEWLSSGGNKDNIDNARKRITQAVVGIILFAIAFAVLNLVGIFTGFNFTVTKNSPGCSQPEEFFPEATGCTHRIWRNNVPNFEGRCVAVYEKVDASFCGR